MQPGALSTSERHPTRYVIFVGIANCKTMPGALVSFLELARDYSSLCKAVADPQFAITFVGFVTGAKTVSRAVLRRSRLYLFCVAQSGEKAAPVRARASIPLRTLRLGKIGQVFFF